ncbi:MAG: hypothetical protein JKY48_01600 [Flavobacteriales bacterium]|nr:hypothetical protein [Flavobacteriales bacterium]
MKLNGMKAALVGIAMVALVFTACSGEDGDDGLAGATGATGNANVTASNYTVLQADWAGTGSATFSAPSIIQSVVNTGSVQAYITAAPVSDSTVWGGLPGGNFSFSYKTDSITFLTPGFTGANFTTYYKVVVIPSSAMVDGVNLDNYEEVKMVYGIKEYDVN